MIGYYCNHPNLFNLIAEFPTLDGTVVALKHDGKFVDSISEGDRCRVLVDKTSFYAENGGQKSDSGHITTSEVRLNTGAGGHQRSRPLCEFSDKH